MTLYIFISTLKSTSQNYSISTQLITQNEPSTFIVYLNAPY